MRNGRVSQRSAIFNHFPASIHHKRLVTGQPFLQAREEFVDECLHRQTPNIQNKRIVMTLDQVLSGASEKMTKCITAVEHQFSGVRTTKASPALVENVDVEAYGNVMKVREVATITTPEPRVLLLQPWDAGTVKAIEKGILKSNLGITPQVSGKTIRLVLPELSQERRQELVKLVNKYAEDGRVSIRQVRREALEGLKALKKENKITEDDQANTEKKVQKLTDDFIAKVGEKAAEKEKEIMKV